MAKRISIRDTADRMGLSIEWHVDEDPDLSWLEPGETVREVLGCVVKDRRGHHLASLWGITDPDDAYAREVEADLLEEAISEIRASVLEAI